MHRLCNFELSDELKFRLFQLLCYQIQNRQHLKNPTIVRIVPHRLVDRRREGKHPLQIGIPPTPIHGRGYEVPTGASVDTSLLFSLSAGVVALLHGGGGVSQDSAPGKQSTASSF